MHEAPAARRRGAEVAVTGLAALCFAVVASGRPAWAYDPLDPGTRVGRPGHIVHSHDGTRAYRANGAPRGISVLEPDTLRVLREIATDQPVDLVALSQDGRWLYGMSPRADHLVVIETATERIVGRIPLRLPGAPR